jgi:DNA-binding NtrC family response regulator
MFFPIIYVDSDNDTYDHFQYYLSEYFNLLSFKNPLDCLEVFKQDKYPLVISNFNIHPIDGLRFLSDIKKLSPITFRLLMVDPHKQKIINRSGHSVVSMDKFKNFGPQIIKKQLDREYFRFREEYFPSFVEKNDLPVIIGSSSQVLELLRKARKISNLSGSVLISGDTGTGKDLLAKYIHQSGNRSGGPLQIVNCSAISSQLFESEFFGHRKGSFTGASENHTGFFYEADGGTLVLDEISEIDLIHQAKLLRAIENQEIYPVGSQKMIKINSRIIAITNKDLSRLVKEGKFREDLYHRLNRIHLHLPPLSQRIEDLRALSSYFVQKCVRQYHLGSQVKFSACFFDLLSGLNLRGNIRELENIIYQCLISKSSESRQITRQDLEKILKEEHPQHNPENHPTLRNLLDENERNHIYEVLKRVQLNISRAAKVLGISRQSLQYKMKKYNITV